MQSRNHGELRSGSLPKGVGIVRPIRVRLTRPACAVSLLLATFVLLHAPGIRGEGATGAPGAQGSVLKAPDFTAKDLKGRNVRLSDLLKKGPVFLDFWTTWCKPCKLELPELDRLHRTYREHGFQVVAISEDDPRTLQGVDPLIRQKKYEFLVLVDPKNDVGNSFNVRNYPTSFLVAKDRTVAHFAQGYTPGDEKTVEQRIRGLLGLGAGAPDSGKKR